MIRWQSLGPLHSGYLGNIMVVDAFDGGDGASWTARGMQLGRGPSPHTVIVASIGEAKAAAEAYVAAWMRDAGVVIGGAAASTHLTAFASAVENHSKHVNKSAERGIAGGS